MRRSRVFLKGGFDLKIFFSQPLRGGQTVHFVNCKRIAQQAKIAIVLNRKFSAALQQVELPSALAQVGTLSMISSLYCWINACLETNLLFLL